jgi:haloacetate dehalogenase
LRGSARLRGQRQARLGRDPRAVLETGDGPGPARADARARLRTLRTRRARPRRSSRAATGARLSRWVSRLAILDIVPTETIYGLLDQERATTVWRYFFLVQSPDLPERLIGADPGFYLEWTLQEWCGTPGALDETAVSEYRRCFDAATIHAGCEDYRAGATIDLAHDRADRERIHCPVLVLWSAHGIGSSYDVLSIWRRVADAVQGRALDCGHFLAEERPAETAIELTRFLEQR